MKSDKIDIVVHLIFLYEPELMKKGYELIAPCALHKASRSPHFHYNKKEINSKRKIVWL